LCSHSIVSQHFMDPKACHRVHKSSPLVPILSQTNPVHPTPLYIYKIHLMLSTQLRLGLPSGFFPSGFLTNILYKFLFSPIRAKCPAHLILFDLIILIVLSEDYKMHSSSLFSSPPRHFIPLRSRYYPQDSVLKHSQCVLLP
jgi:hypothetical protein